MRPPKRASKVDFEKVKIGELIPGQIAEIQYENEHKFKGFEGGEDTIQPAVRFKLKLDGYEWAHYSRWMRFSLHEKANLYKKYISKLVENASPDMDFDLDMLKLMRIKTIWSENGDFQNIDAIYPEGKKVVVELPPPDEDEPLPDEPDFLKEG